VLPGFAGVGGFVHAIALHDIAAQLGFAHAEVEDVGVGFGDGDGADAGAVDLAIGDGAPGEPAVGGLPESAADRAEVVFERGGGGGGRDRSAAAIGADAAPGEIGENCGVDRSGAEKRGAHYEGR